MRMTTLVALAAGLVLLTPDLSEARDYPFCATYNDDTGARNCGFDTMAQCRAAVSGAGGFCEMNPAYRSAAVPAPRRQPYGR